MTTDTKEVIYQQTIANVTQTLEEADMILVGGASGMSAAGGASWYSNDETYQKYFGKFEEKYQVGSVWNLFYLEYNGKKWLSRGHYWAFLITLMKWIRQEPVYQPYKDLKKILEGKEYEIVTTNQDHQFVEAFPKKDIAIIQGDWTYFQCSARCHDEVYSNVDIVDDLYEKIDGIYLDESLIPRCDKCGAEMQEWVRGYTFLEGSFYKEQYDKYHDFIEKTQGKKAVFLELGVGMMTPMFIKEPFINLTYNNTQASYITINPKHALVPKEIEGQSIAVQEDIAKVMKDVLRYQESVK